MIDTFSANSLKILDKSASLFQMEYVEGIKFIEQNKDAQSGNRLHAIISYCLKGYDTSKFESVLDKNEALIFSKLKKSEILNFAIHSNEKFIEQPFFIKEDLNNKPFYLTGRFDAVIKNGDKYTILDWKTNNIPKNPDSDIQTVVYFEAAKKLFKTENLDMIYYSLEKEECAKIQYSGGYLDRIKGIISKIIQ